MRKSEKIEAVSDIKKHLEESNAIFITDFSGLNVADITVLRKDLRENSTKFMVAKNTLMKIAATDAGMEEILKFIDGPTALAFSVDDPAQPAKILYDSFKKREMPVIKAFVVDKQLFSGSEIVRLAELPTRDILLSRVVSAVEAPASNLVTTLDGLFQELMATVEALGKSKE